MVLEYGAVTLAFALFYYFGRTEEMRMLGKWLFLSSAMVTSFVIWGTVGSPETLGLFIAMVVTWVVLFLLEVIMVLPRAIELASKRMKR